MIKKLNEKNDKIFLSKSNKLSNCYVCLNETEFESPCVCNISLCNKCFVNVLLKNGNKCSICKANFNSEIIKNVRSTHSELLEFNNLIYSENNNMNEIYFEPIVEINFYELQNRNFFFFYFKILKTCFLCIPVRKITIFYITIFILNYYNIITFKNILFGLFVCISLFINYLVTAFFLSNYFFYISEL